MNIQYGKKATRICAWCCSLLLITGVAAGQESAKQNELRIKLASVEQLATSPVWAKTVGRNQLRNAPLASLADIERDWRHPRWDAFKQQLMRNEAALVLRDFVAERGAGYTHGYVLDEHGAIAAMWPASTNFLKDESQEFRVGFNNGRGIPSISQRQFDPTVGRDVHYLATPIRDSDDRMVGVLVVGVDSDIPRSNSTHVSATRADVTSSQKHRHVRALMSMHAQ